jgi:hypothetical protein
MAASSVHAWKFFRAGGFNQVQLETGADLANLDQLDPKLWVALACPAHGLEFDDRTLELIDSDRDGRIRAPEIIAAAKWATGLLRNPDDLIRGSATLPLAAIDDRTPEGLGILASARRTLQSLGKAEATSISLEDTVGSAESFAATRFNGDGIITAEAVDDEAARSLLADILACLGPDIDRSGQPGAGQAKVELFFTEAQAFSQWWRAAEEDPGLLPLGEATVAAYGALAAVRTKVDDYFARCRLAAFDPRALPALNRQESDYSELAALELSRSVVEAAGFPLARIEPGRALPLREGLNPAWIPAMAALAASVLDPLLGVQAALTEADWARTVAAFAGFERWSGDKAGPRVEPLGLARVRELIEGRGREELTALIAQDLAQEPEANAIAAVEKLIRYHRDLHRLCINFVNFKNFYDRSEPSIFQAGTLYLDQRSCELTLPVENTGRHAAMAGMAGAYLAYCDCVRQATGEKRTIVAIFSQGDDDNLMVGRNGLFLDRKGQDYDATIAKIVSNPISLRQAFWAPYKKIVRLIEQQIAKHAAATETQTHGHLAKATEVPAPGSPARKEEKKIDVGTVAALGVAVGAISTALAYFMGLFKGIAAWQFPLLAAALILLISMPSMVLAFMQLRKRNLGPILDANGWAVNAKAKINVPFGTSLTGIARLPPGSTVEAGDKFAEKASVWPKVLLALFLLWWLRSYLNEEGWIYRWTDGRYGKVPEAVRPVENRKPAA